MDATDRCKSARGNGSRPSTPLDYPELEPPEEDVSITEDICNEDSLVSDGKRHLSFCL